LQPARSFKSRGIGNYIETQLKVNGSSDKTHFYASSGGNAGLAAVVAAKTLGYPASVVVPMSCKPFMIAKLKAAGASEIIQIGSSVSEADAYLREVILVANPHAVYVPPFDHPYIWEGHSTLVREVKQQLASIPTAASFGYRTGATNGFTNGKTNGLTNGKTNWLTNGHSNGQMNGGAVRALNHHEDQENKPDAIICSVGGGGLFIGIMEGLQEAGWADVPVVAIETAGAESLNAALRAGELVTLPSINSQATSLGANRVAKRAFEHAQKGNVRSVVLSDGEAAMGCWRLADDERIMVELACGVNVALCYDGRLEQALGKKLTKESKVVIVLCGGSNVTVEMLAGWRKEFGYVEIEIPKHVNIPSSITAPIGVTC
jgi:L-serine/L-threonine ammonia-lyase